MWLQWPQWLRSRSQSQSSPRSPRTPTFACSSFKDISSLSKEEPAFPFSHRRNPSVFQQVRISHRNAASSLPLLVTKPSIIIYFTTLRVVRKTFQECKTVRSILRGFRVPIDERDLSMDAMFADELQFVFGLKGFTLPVVFIGGRYVGGADEIRKLYETGDLEKMIGNFPKDDSGVCNLCGGLRFVVCDQCNGSHRVYWEKTGFKNCVACNVSGLIGCPYCSPVPLRCKSIK